MSKNLNFLLGFVGLLSLSLLVLLLDGGVGAGFVSPTVCNIFCLYLVICKFNIQFVYLMLINVGLMNVIVLVCIGHCFVFVYMKLYDCCSVFYLKIHVPNVFSRIVAQLI